MTNLIARLGDPNRDWPEFGHDRREAKDRIEKLEKERDELGRKLNTARYGQPDFAWSIHEEAMADLRAKLAKAVEALRSVDDEYSDTKWGPELTSIKEVRAALAELEGKE